VQVGEGRGGELYLAARAGRGCRGTTRPNKRFPYVICSTLQFCCQGPAGTALAVNWSPPDTHDPGEQRFTLNRSSRARGQSAGARRGPVVPEILIARRSFTLLPAKPPQLSQPTLERGCPLSWMTEVGDADAGLTSGSPARMSEVGPGCVIVLSSRLATPHRFPMCLKMPSRRRPVAR
jgi:hypothetical protein